MKHSPDTETLLIVATCHSGCHLLPGIIAILTDNLAVLQRTKVSHDQIESKLRMLTFPFALYVRQIRPWQQSVSPLQSRYRPLHTLADTDAVNAARTARKEKCILCSCSYRVCQGGCRKKSRKTACFYILKMLLWAELGSFPIGLHLDKWLHRPHRQYRQNISLIVIPATPLRWHAVSVERCSELVKCTSAVHRCCGSILF